MNMQMASPATHAISIQNDGTLVGFMAFLFPYIPILPQKSARWCFLHPVGRILLPILLYDTTQALYFQYPSWSDVNSIRILLLAIVTHIILCQTRLDSVTALRKHGMLTRRILQHIVSLTAVESRGRRGGVLLQYSSPITSDARVTIVRLLRRFLAVPGDATPLCSPAAVAQAASLLEVTGHLNRVLTSMQSPDPWHRELKKLLRPLFHQHISTTLRLFEDAKLVLHALATAEIPHIPFKGPFLAMDLYDDPLFRSCSDIDIILPQGRASLVAVRKALESLGYAPPSTDPVLLDFYETAKGEYPLVAAGRFEVDLHHAPYDGFPRDAFSEVSSRAVIADGEIPKRLRMSAIDTLMFFCAHYWTEPGQLNLKWLIDCAALFTNPSTFPDGWADLVRRWGFSFYVTVAAKAVNNVFGVTPATANLRELEDDLDKSQKQVCERVERDGPDSLPKGLVHKLHHMRLPRAERNRLIWKYIWPHPGLVVMDNPWLKKRPGFRLRLWFAAKRILRALRTR